MYLEFLFLRAHSRKRVERMYWSGLSLNSLHHLLKFCNRGNDRSDGFRFSPIRIATSLCHMCFFRFEGISSG